MYTRQILVQYFVNFGIKTKWKESKFEYHNKKFRVGSVPTTTEVFFQKKIKRIPNGPDFDCDCVGNNCLL